ncbi:MAG: hypothetical protein AAFQ82_25095, partial [Myxococcota bacterium]
DPGTRLGGLLPDHYHSVVSASTVTQRKIALSAGELILPSATEAFHPVYDELSEHDGFAVTAQLFVRFFARIDVETLPPSGPGSADADASVQLFELDSEPIERVEFEWELVEDSSGGSPDQTLLLSPIRALKPKTRYGLAVTNTLKTTDGDCIAPSSTMGSILDGTATGFDHVLPPIERLVAALVADDAIDNAGELTLAVTFQTQSVTEESVELTDTVRAREVQFSSDGPCETQQPGILRCTGTLNALDYRGDDGVIGVADRFAPRAVALGVTAWIPDEPGPHQSVIFGHGLGGDREQAQFLADQVVSPQSGTKSAVIAPDAPFHGTHPDCAGRSCPDLLTFFGFDISSLPLRFEGHRFRDNLRQANLDKQHIVNAILGGLDVDDDGVDDFASDGIHYVGGSLGGIMGGEFVAMTPELDTVSLIVPGARLIDVIREIDAAPV